jgi:hypothetical protein
MGKSVTLTTPTKTMATKDQGTDERFILYVISFLHAEGGKEELAMLKNPLEFAEY